MRIAPLFPDGLSDELFKGDLGDDAERWDLIADILLALFGEDALAWFDVAAKDEKGRYWDAASHPRGPDGRFMSAGGPAALASATAKVAAALKAPKSPDSHRQLTEHLGILSVQQLKQVKAEHGIKASGKNKAELVAKLADRLDRGRRTPEAPKPAPPKPEAKPAAPEPVAVKPAPAAPPAAPAPPAFPRGQPVKTEFGRIDGGAVSWRDHAPKEQRAALKAYTSNKTYSKVNAPLRQGAQPADLPGPEGETARRMAAAIEATPTFEKPVTVYRGLALGPEGEAKLVAKYQASLEGGRVLRNRGFMSSSLDKDVALTFSSGAGEGGVIMEIKANKGAYLEGSTAFKGEHELLLNHGAGFRVTGIKKQTIKGRKRTVIRMEQVK